MENQIKMYDPTRDYYNHRPEYDAAISNVLKSGAFINGPQVRELEEQLSDYVGCQCIAVSNGTDALHIALLALGVGHGDEVITVPFTWISSAEVIPLVGAIPVFVDIDKATYNLDPDLLEAKITTKTKSIIVVDLFGQMADYPRINKIAQKHGIHVIQDFAQSFGAEQNHVKAGNQGIISCTSFFPSKPIGCYGDGGACFTKDPILAQKMKAIRNHGGVVRFYHDEVGMNARLDTLQAGILLVKLKYFDEQKIKREEIADFYRKKLEAQYWIEKSPVKLPYTLSINNLHVYAAFTIRVKDRDQFLEYLKKNGVELSVFYPKPLHFQPIFIEYGYQNGDFPVSEKVAGEVISLPCYPELEEWEKRTIISLIKSYYQIE